MSWMYWPFKTLINAQSELIVIRNSTGSGYPIQEAVMSPCRLASVRLHYYWAQRLHFSTSQHGRCGSFQVILVRSCLRSVLNTPTHASSGLSLCYLDPTHLSICLASRNIQNVFLYQIHELHDKLIRCKASCIRLEQWGNICRFFRVSFHCISGALSSFGHDWTRRL